MKKSLSLAIAIVAISAVGVSAATLTSGHRTVTTAAPSTAAYQTPASQSAKNTRTRSGPQLQKVGTDAEQVASKVRIDVKLHKVGQQSVGGTGQWANMQDFMQFVVEDSANVWNWYYKQWGVTSPSTVNYSFPLPGQSVPMGDGCGGMTKDTTAEYCPTDDTIYFSQALAVQLWDGTVVGPDGQQNDGPGGDFAVAYALAHEYGHNVDQELGILQNPNLTTPQLEQHADCMAGAFTRVAYFQGILDTDDVQQGLNAASLVGDSDFAGADHHGTSAERMAAFAQGYNSAAPDGCNSLLG
jgi:hypothetical protein